MGIEAKIVRMKDLNSPAGSLPVAWVEHLNKRDVAVPMARLAEILDYDRKTLYRMVEGDPVLSSFRVVVTTLWKP